MLSLSAVAQITGGQLYPAAAADTPILAAEIDTRRLTPGALFFALTGAVQDGHDYVAAAAAAGGAAAVVRYRQECALPQIIVEDTAAALRQLAQFWRRQYRGMIAAVTGSNGKTTVKEMLYSIMAAAVGGDNALRTQGNFNNHLGVPLTLLKLKPTHQLAVLEAGMDHAGELTELSALIKPEVALINNVQRAHTENFASLHDIALAKGELLSGLSGEGIAVLNADDDYFPLWCELAADRDVLSFGTSSAADITGELTADGIMINGKSITLAVPGVHNKMNALAAAAAAAALRLPPEAVASGLSAYSGVAGRLAMSKLSDTVMLIDDSYNANPDSAAAVLDVLAAIAKREKTQPLLVMGDMLALGDKSAAAHQALVASCAERSIMLFAVGTQMKNACTANGYGDYFEDRKILVEKISQLAEQSSALCILVKGSRGMRMEEICSAIGGRISGGGG